MRLGYNFFVRNSVEVARDLIGKKFIFGNKTGIILETESYRGLDDPASHAYRGPTKRTQIMFEEPGRIYVYLIYGMYHCINIVTEEKGTPSAVLLRGLEIDNLYLNGPGKICRYLNIDRSFNGIDLLTHEQFYVEDNPIFVPDIAITPRIGISKNKDAPWRFIHKLFKQ